MKIIAAHNGNPLLRAQSSAGGVFSQLASNVLDKGGVVFGVAFDDNWNIKHTKIATNDDLARLRGSKYAFSAIGNTITEACQELDCGREVLFSGTPCQIAALRKRAGQHPNLLCVEIVCHGAPKQEYWNRYLNELCAKLKKRREDIKFINFRDKRTGWKDYSFTIIFIDGTCFSQRHDDNLYMRAFLKDYTIRDVCFRCPFKHPQGSHADITLGDLWGISCIAPHIDNNLGTTLIISSSELGDAALKYIQTDAELNFKIVADANPAIVSCAMRPADKHQFDMEAANGIQLTAIFRKFAGRPWGEKMFLVLARTKHKFLSILK